MKKTNLGNPNLTSEVTELTTNSSNISVVSITIGIKKSGGYADKIPPQSPLTKKRFEALLVKSESHLSDGYTDKCTSQDKTVSKED
jgi:hypothetical protein